MTGRAQAKLTSTALQRADVLELGPRFPGQSASDAEVLSRLVAAIYDAALAPDQWPAVLSECSDFVGGMSASLFAKDAGGIAGGIFYVDGNISPAYAQLYFEKYAPFDPVTGGHLLTPLEEPVGTADLMDIDEFRACRFYREWAKPQGIADMVIAPIEKQGGWAAMFGVFLSDSYGLTSDTTKERMRLLIPHVRRSVMIGKVLERDTMQAASLEDAFDGLASGMFLVDATGRVVHANMAGDALLKSGVIGTRDGRIVAGGRDASRALAEVFAAAGMGDEAVGVRGISVTLPGSGDETYVAHVLPLTSGTRRRTGARYSAVAAMFVRRATLDLPAAPEVMARTYGLTLTELRVLTAIVQVGGVPETSEALGIAETTVKTHLHRVFAKTGTSRQADLVRLVAGFVSPLVL